MKLKNLLKAAAIVEQAAAGFTNLADQSDRAVGLALYLQSFQHLLLELGNQQSRGRDPFRGVLMAFEGEDTALTSEKLALLRAVTNGLRR